jgi:histidine kinase
VNADDGKMRQIISNIVDNSIKYTQKGGVRILLEHDNKQHKIRIKVSDSGIGLSQDDVHHLFGKFTRGSQGQRENTEGSGLGLYVASHMLEAQHGKIWVDSPGPGLGSTFIIELPSEH